eukprot:4501322-Pleurochrysis_carterae.AAC.1
MAAQRPAHQRHQLRTQHATAATPSAVAPPRHLSLSPSWRPGHTHTPRLDAARQVAAANVAL